MAAPLTAHRRKRAESGSVSGELLSRVLMFQRLQRAQALLEIGVLTCPEYL